MIAAIEAGFFRREIADAAFAYQREVDAKRKLIVGVNAFQEAGREAARNAGDRRYGGEGTGGRSCSERKAQRDGEAVRRLLGEVRRVAATKENLMPALLEAARARCTVGEIMTALADVFGRYDGAAQW